MQKVLPFLVVGFLIVTALIGSIIYSSDTAISECSGVMTAPNNSGPITLFAEITQYRWWAFWNPFRWTAAFGNSKRTHSDCF